MAAPATRTDTKADFVERFARFITWPNAATPAAGESFVIGLAGTGEVSERLRQIAPNREVRGHSLRIVDVERLRDLEDCHIVLIEASALRDLESIVEVTGTRPILTIAVSPGMAGSGPLIAFREKDDGVGFTIDTKAVARSGLRFSTKLLRLGTAGGG